MATSPNYAWAEPDNSSLVKNGASDIRTLGDAIDTSVWNVGFGQAGKNKIINGDFSINQRNFTSVTTQDFGFDRWIFAPSGATGTFTPQTFTAGTAPVAGYEGKNFARLAITTGNDYCRLQQSIESVRTFAGNTVTVSFWAKGTNPATAGNLKVNLSQYFGTGGSPSATVTSTAQTFVLTANWTRYSFTIAMPSISGKTIGTNNNDTIQLWIGQETNTSADAWTLDLWGVQVEYGSKATPFQTASGGSIQGELAMCQRYYQKYSGDSIAFMNGTYYSTTSFYGVFTFPIMRVAPTTTTPATALNVFSGGSNRASTNVLVAQISTSSLEMQGTTSAATAGDGAWVRFNTGGQIELSAEL